MGVMLEQYLGTGMSSPSQGNSQLELGMLVPGVSGANQGYQEVVGSSGKKQREEKYRARKVVMEIFLCVLFVFNPKALEHEPDLQFLSSSSNRM